MSRSSNTAFGTGGFVAAYLLTRMGLSSVVLGLLIGTVIAAAPPRIGSVLARAASASGHLNLELHGIDALDGSDGAPPALVAAQPGLRTPASLKLRRLREVLAAVRDKAEFATLEKSAVRLLPGPH